MNGHRLVDGIDTHIMPLRQGKQPWHAPAVIELTSHVSVKLNQKSSETNNRWTSLFNSFFPEAGGWWSWAADQPVRSAAAAASLAHSLTRWLIGCLTELYLISSPSLLISLCSVFFSLITPPSARSNLAASLLSPPPVSPHSSVHPPRRASLSWPSRGTSWGPTRPSSRRNTRTPARTAEPLTPLSGGKTWRARAEEGARPTATGPSMAPVATSVRTTETRKANVGGGGSLCWRRLCPN